MMQSKEYEMKVNGKIISNYDEYIADAMRVYGLNRSWKLGEPTLYFFTKKGDAKMRIYNKSTEIKNASNKEYIEDWNEYGRADIYRIEITLKNEAIKDYQAYLLSQEPNPPQEPNKIQIQPLQSDIDALNYALCDEACRLELWRYFADKMMIFSKKNKNGQKQPITLLDIITEEALP